MSTLATMKARIASELGRDDLTAEIAAAITTAIDAYHDQKFWFTWDRERTFATVADQQAYTAAANSDIADALEIDHALITVSGTVNGMTQVSQGEIEDTATPVLTGEPTSFSWFDDAIYLYPVPVAVYSVRLVGRFLVDPPGDDDETENRWMTTAERLVRSRAKWELAMHVMEDDALANRMGAAITEAREQLASITKRRRRRGRGARIQAVHF